MTEFDKQLIQKANHLCRWDYPYIDTMIVIADTDEARRRLAQIRQDLYDLILETI